eukprot:scaffold33559_cov63-Phaeocystis_antarctica.AAC.5
MPQPRRGGGAELPVLACKAIECRSHRVPQPCRTHGLCAPASCALEGSTVRTLRSTRTSLGLTLSRRPRIQDARADVEAVLRHCLRRGGSPNPSPNRSPSPDPNPSPNPSPNPYPNPDPNRSPN